MQFRLRTLLVALILGPVLLAGIWHPYTTAPLGQLHYLGPRPPAIRPGLNVPALIIAACLPLAVLAARRLIFGKLQKTSPAEN